jgi:hypothetical protein
MRRLEKLGCFQFCLVPRCLQCSRRTGVRALCELVETIIELHLLLYAVCALKERRMGTKGLAARNHRYLAMCGNVN